MKLILPTRKRPLGLFISGKPGTGKSSLLQHLILGDMQQSGVCVIDPTADLVNILLDWVPEHRKNDVVYFDTSFPIPLDLFSYAREDERQVLVDQLVALFSLDSAPISKPRLIKLIGTLLDANNKGGDFTFLDIKHFLEKKSVRDKVFSLVPHRREDWPAELFKSNKEFSSIIERMTPFAESSTLRTIFGPGKKLNIEDLMNEGKILLVNLKDTSTDYFIGSLICIKFQQATFARRYIPEPQRIPFYLYIDECSTIINYAEEHFEQILTRARKYKLCLTLATQQEDLLTPKLQRRLKNIETHLIFTGRFQAATLKDNQWVYVQTPTPLGRRQNSYAEYIQKRTVDTYSCGNPSVPHTEGNGVDYDHIPPEVQDPKTH